MDANGNLIPQESIALFGPTASGKDWLIRAFAREIEKINQKGDHLFYYELMELQRDYSPRPASAFPPIGNVVTNMAEDYLYQFTRRADTDQRYSCYEYTHNIAIQNDAGSILVSSIVDADTFSQTYNRLVTARNLIIIIAPPDSPSTPVQTKVEDQESSDLIKLLENMSAPQEPAYSSYLPEFAIRPWTATDYQHFIRLLFDALGRNRTGIRRRNIAICLTKIDQTRIQNNDSEQVFYSMFPGLRGLIQMERNRHNIEFFQTSSAGFINRSDALGRVEQIPNIQNGNLIDVNRWSPFGTTRPFFWIFETLEKAYLANNSGGLRNILRPRPDYPPYIVR